MSWNLIPENFGYLVLWTSGTMGANRFDLVDLLQVYKTILKSELFNILMNFLNPYRSWGLLLRDLWWISEIRICVQLELGVSVQHYLMRTTVSAGVHNFLKCNKRLKFLDHFCQTSKGHIGQVPSRVFVIISLHPSPFIFSSLFFRTYRIPTNCSVSFEI